MNLSSLPQQLPRILTGLLLAAALVTSLLLGGFYLRALICVISTLALFEFFQMLWPGRQKICSKLFGLFIGLAIFCPGLEHVSLTILLALTAIWTALVFLFTYGRGDTTVRFASFATVPLGLLYIPVILNLALSLSLREQVLVVAAAIVSDIAAYYVGCAFGRHKIWPSVSPKKSWEGSIGGFLASTAATVAIACLPFGETSLHGYGLIFWLCAGSFLNVAGQLGDFFESALKRSCNVKDSGTILPGHGGVLDRIDSIIFTVAAYSTLILLAKNAISLKALFAAA